MSIFLNFNLNFVLTKTNRKKRNVYFGLSSLLCFYSSFSLHFSVPQIFIQKQIVFSEFGCKYANKIYWCTKSSPVSGTNRTRNTESEGTTAVSYYYQVPTLRHFYKLNKNKYIFIYISTKHIKHVEHTDVTVKLCHAIMYLMAMVRRALYDSI